MNLGCGPTCGCGKQAGLGQFDVIGSAVGGIFSSIWGAHAAKENVKTQAHSAMKLAKQQAAAAQTQLEYEAAIQAQQDAVDQSKAIRNAEILGLVLVGGAAVLISLYFIRGATKKGN